MLRFPASDVENGASLLAPSHGPNVPTRQSPGSASWLRASHASTILAMTPLFAAVLFLLVCTASRSSLDGLVSIAGYLQPGTPIVDLMNYWLIFVFAGVPLLLPLDRLSVHGHGIRLALRLGAEPGAEGSTHLDDATHAQLVKLGGKWAASDVITPVLLGTYMIVAVVQMFALLQAAVWLRVLVCALMVIVSAASVFAQPLARVGIYRAQGAHALAVLERAERRVVGVFLLSLAVLGYQLVLITTAPPFTSAMLQHELAARSPCLISRNATYQAEHCRPSSAADGPRLVCADGGFGAYVSAYAACDAAEAVFSVTSKCYAASGLFVNAFLCMVFHSRYTSFAAKYPATRVLARLAMGAVVGVCAPLCVGIVLMPSLARTWLTTADNGFYLLLGNIVFGALAISTLNLEALVERLDALSTGSRDLEVAMKGGATKQLRPELLQLLEAQLQAIADDATEATTAGGSGAGGGGGSRFVGEPAQMVHGEPTDAALGVNYYMGFVGSMPALGDGVAAIQREFAAHGTDVDRECLDYVLHQRAGSNPRTFDNGGLRRDCDADGNVLACRLNAAGLGMDFSDFVSDPRARDVAKLSPAHVLALRLYTTAAFRSLNDPLRNARQASGAGDSGGGARQPHPFPVTINLISEGISQLRSVGAASGADGPLDLWRGLKQLKVGDGFGTEGGTELAPMSTTTALAVAVAYALSPHMLLFKVRTRNFMQRGADLGFLSAFPAEAEILFPPLTYLRPTGRRLTLKVRDVRVTVLEVEPHK